MRSWGKSLCLEGQQKLSSKKASAPPEDSAAAKRLLGVGVGVASGEAASGCRKLPRGILFLVIGGGLSLLFGCLSILWTPFDILMRERLKMVPGLPPFEWWKSPPDEVLLRVYVFNITNAEEFLSGADQKLKMEEIGPFIFLEKLEHRNVSFHSNQTMTYTAVRSAVWLPEKNNISLNGTLIVPNLAVLGIASYIYDANFMTKFAYNMLVRGLNSKPLIETSIYNYLWNFSDPFLHVTKKILPFMVPATNIGMLSMIYLDFQDEVTVYIGPENVKKFFTMDKFHGSDRFNYWPDEICDSVKTATEGVIYPQFLTRNDSLSYFRKTMCRITPVYYAADIEQDGIAAYRFDLPDNIYDRPENLDEECYTNHKAPLLPSGLTDVSPCFYDFPIAASNPHFLNADPEIFDIVEGMKPERNKHYSYVIVEPTTGIPLESRARSQSNLIMRKIKGMPIAEKFSNLIIPMFWAEYNQVGLPDYVFNLMYFMVKVLPILQTWLSFFMVMLGSGMFLSGLYLISCVFREKRHNKSYNPIDLIQISS